MRDYKQILIESLDEYKSSSVADRKTKFDHVVNMLSEHNQHISSIGMGYANRFVTAAILFIRLVKLYKL